MSKLNSLPNGMAKPNHLLNVTPRENVPTSGECSLQLAISNGSFE